VLGLVHGPRPHYDPKGRPPLCRERVQMALQVGGWEPHGRLITAAAACWCLAVGIAGTVFARQITELKWRHGLPLDKLSRSAGLRAP
jgi:hypothetical protein